MAIADVVSQMSDVLPAVFPVQVHPVGGVIAPVSVSPVGNVSVMRIGNPPDAGADAGPLLRATSVYVPDPGELKLVVLSVWLTARSYCVTADATTVSSDELSLVESESLYSELCVTVA